MLRPGYFPGAWSSWHLQVQRNNGPLCAHLKNSQTSGGCPQHIPPPLSHPHLLIAERKIVFSGPVRVWTFGIMAK